MARWKAASVFSGASLDAPLFEEYEAGKYVEWNDREWEKLSVSSAVIYNVKFEDIFNTITIN